MVSAIPAMMMLYPEYSIPWPVLMLWVFCLAVLGVVMAIPMKRNMINQEKLRFPSGTAAAVTLQSLYSESKESLAKARALFSAGAVGRINHQFYHPSIRRLDLYDQIVEHLIIRRWI